MDANTIKFLLKKKGKEKEIGGPSGEKHTWKLNLKKPKDNKNYDRKRKLWGKGKTKDKKHKKGRNEDHVRHWNRRGKTKLGRKLKLRIKTGIGGRKNCHLFAMRATSVTFACATCIAIASLHQLLLFRRSTPRVVVFPFPPCTGLDPSISPILKELGCRVRRGCHLLTKAPHLDRSWCALSQLEDWIWIHIVSRNFLGCPNPSNEFLGN
jgi:hypothetical protein